MWVWKWPHMRFSRDHFEVPLIETVSLEVAAYAVLTRQTFCSSEYVFEECLDVAAHAVLTRQSVLALPLVPTMGMHAGLDVVAHAVLTRPFINGTCSRTHETV